MKKYSELSINVILWAIIYISFVYFIVTERIEDIINNQGIFSYYAIYTLFIVPIFGILGPFINFYLFYFVLIPKLLDRKKVFLFISFALLSSYIIGNIFRLTFAGTSEISKIIAFTLMSLFGGILSIAIRKIVIWRKSVEEKIILNKKLYSNKTALLMLQAQLNPHFLFNSLNNIDVLVEENPKTASEYLKKLSDILRYVLYETKEIETELSKEIEQIKSYMELQKIRTDNPHYVNFSIKGELKDQKIAPMIFIPFVENAFKHCKNKSIENAINIEFEINKESIKMICKNYYEANQLEIIKNEGLGIETIKQRLNLLYPKNHQLVIDKTENWFNVGLSIQLKDVN